MSINKCVVMPDSFETYNGDAIDFSNTKKDLEIVKLSLKQRDVDGLVLFEGQTNNSDIKNGDRIKGLTSLSKKIVTVVITESCAIVPEIQKEICIIGRISADFIYAECIGSKLFFDLLDSGSLSDKVDLLKWYSNLPNNKQVQINNQLLGERNKEFVSCVNSRFMELQDMINRFNLCKSRYDTQQQADIEQMIQEAKTGHGTRKERAIRRLQYIINIDDSGGCATSVKKTKKEIVSELNKYIYKLDHVKDRIAEAIIAGEYANNKGMNILLVGNPGVGKTTIAIATAKVLNVDYNIIPFGSFTDKLEIVGDAPQYDASDAGCIVREFYIKGNTQIALILDDIDKTENYVKDGNPLWSISDMIGDNHFFRDSFLCTHIRTRNTRVIATANSIEDIPEFIRDRFAIIEVDDYSDNDKYEIARNYLWPNILEEYGLSSRKFTIEDSALWLIIREYCIDDGVRDLKRHLELITRKMIASYDNPLEIEVFISESDVKIALEGTVTENSPYIRYRKHKELYSTDIAAEIERLLKSLRKPNIYPERRATMEKQLGYLLAIAPIGKAFSGFDLDVFQQQVDKTHYGMSRVKDEIARELFLKSNNGENISTLRLLLVGGPGSGKSSIVKSIAEACGAPLAKISLNGISDPKEIKGFPSTYNNSKGGAILDAIEANGTTKGIIQLDELDKVFTHGGKDVSNTLLDILDNSNVVQDNFITPKFSLKETLIIATANNLQDINPTIIDRFKVVYIDGYTQKERITIVKNYIVPKVISEYSVCNSIEFDEAALKLLVEDYCTTLGIRSIEQAVRTIVSSWIYENREKPNESKYTFRSEDVKKYLGKQPPIPRGNYPNDDLPGIARALAVTNGGNQGLSFPIQTLFLPGNPELITTGMPMESTVDSIKLALSHIKSNHGGLVTDGGIHVHFGEGAVPVDGPSAGVAIYLSIISAATGETISRQTAATGEIDLFGNVFAVGGIKEKIIAAKNAGCKLVFVPYDNYVRLDEEFISEMQEIEICGVSHITQVLERIGLNNLDKCR